MIELLNTETNVIVKQFSSFASALTWVQTSKNKRRIPTHWVIREGEKTLRTSQMKDKIVRRDKYAKYYKFLG